MRGRGRHQVHVAVDVDPVVGGGGVLELQVEVVAGARPRVPGVVDVVVVDAVVGVVQAVHGPAPRVVLALGPAPGPEGGARVWHSTVQVAGSCSAGPSTDW